MFSDRLGMDSSRWMGKVDDEGECLRGFGLYGFLKGAKDLSTFRHICIERDVPPEPAKHYCSRK